MRTAIFVYQPTLINISTSESNLELCSINAGTTSLSEGQNARPIVPGIYKIVSSHEIQVTGDTSAFDVVTALNKTDNPPPPPLRATESLGPLDASALQAFFLTPDAKDVVNP